MFDPFDSKSLAKAVDYLNEAQFYGKELPPGERQIVAHFIAGQQGTPYAYATLFGMTETDKVNGYHLFTGEKITYGAKARHVIGEEALRALSWLQKEVPDITEQLEIASKGIAKCILQSRIPGVFCCTGCAPAVLRALELRQLPGIDTEEWIVNFTRALRSYRIDTHRWKRFPFYYTVLALYPFDYPIVRQEMQFILPACERALRQQRDAQPVTQRRRDLLERVLVKFGG